LGKLFVPTLARGLPHMGTLFAQPRQPAMGRPKRLDLMMVPTWLLAAALAALMVSAAPAWSAAASGDGHPPPSVPAITCTNPYSGATWQISIDFDRATVDANPARVSDAEISWFDPKDGGNYKLDRRSGALTVIVASSTGGYFLHDHCRLPP